MVKVNMASKNAKQFVYRYNGVGASEEVEVDRDGVIAVPKQGDIITRKGKETVMFTEMVAGPQAVPVVGVFLTDQLR
jgi:hypothetical protein